MLSPRLGSCLAAIWSGVMACIGLIAAPAAFSMLPSTDAARVVGRMFGQEAHLSLVLALLLFLVVRRQARSAALAGTGSVLGANVLLVLGALFATVAGYFALQPLFAAARMGQGPLTFGMLHAISMGLYALKALLLLALAWRLNGA